MQIGEYINDKVVMINNGTYKYNSKTWRSASVDKASTNQPNPTAGKIAILPLVLADIRSRSDMGLKKYHTRLCSHNGRNAMWDAYQEALDLVMYLRQEIENRKS